MVAKSLKIRHGFHREFSFIRKTAESISFRVFASFWYNAVYIAPFDCLRSAFDKLFFRKNVIFMQTVESNGKGTDCRFSFFKIKRFAWAGNSFLPFSYITFSMNGTNSDLCTMYDDSNTVSLLKSNSISVRLLWFYSFCHRNDFLCTVCLLVCLFVNVVQCFLPLFSPKKTNATYCHIWNNIIILPAKRKSK